jgi:hypothetical protein
MKRYLPILTFFILTSCFSQSSDKLKEKQNVDSINVSNNNERMNFDKVELKPCVITVLNLDTTNELQSKHFNPEKVLLGYKQILYHLTYGTGEMGFAVLSKNNKLTLCLVDCQNNDKIIGTTNIQPLENKEQFVELCQSSCNDYFKTFGVVEEIKYGQVKTIRAWRVNDKDKVIEQLNPESVDCRDSFYTDN